jgi:putative transposase
MEIRKKQKKTGTLKLHFMLQQTLGQHGISIGRDYLFDLMRDHGLAIRKRKRKAITTDSRHWMRKYPNLIKELEVTGPEQLLVSDITYIQLKKQWGYLSLVTDAYSKKIMGWAFRTDLGTQGCLDALAMALSNRVYPQKRLIHHSDRGSQYCSKNYVDMLNHHQISISMTENGDPYENPVAERVNGILKEEFDLYSSTENFKETTKRIKESIQIYNHLRPHASCDFLTPEQAHFKEGSLKKRWKPKRKPSPPCIAQTEITSLPV